MNKSLTKHGQNRFFENKGHPGCWQSSDQAVLKAPVPYKCKQPLLPLETNSPDMRSPSPALKRECVGQSCQTQASTNKCPKIVQSTFVDIYLDISRTEPNALLGDLHRCRPDAPSFHSAKTSSRVETTSVPHVAQCWAKSGSSKSLQCLMLPPTVLSSPRLSP